MKIKKNKGKKVYPSPSSSSSSSSSEGDSLSVLKLLPAAILAFASVLSLDDREVLAYLITRSIKTTASAPSSSSSSIIHRKASKKAAAHGSGVSHNTQQPPVFDCDCFACYTSYWFRWDSSPNRQLIHQAIDAFEDHLTHGESEKSKKNAEAKRRDKTADKSELIVVEGSEDSSVSFAVAAETLLESKVAVAPVSSPKKEAKRFEENEVEVSGDSTAVEKTPEAAANSSSHARNVLPDVLGLFNYRLWSLWSPSA